MMMRADLAFVKPNERSDQVLLHVPQDVSSRNRELVRRL